MIDKYGLDNEDDGGQPEKDNDDDDDDDGEKLKMSTLSISGH